VPEIFCKAAIISRLTAWVGRPISAKKAAARPELPVSHSRLRGGNAVDSYRTVVRAAEGLVSGVSNGDINRKRSEQLGAMLIGYCALRGLLCSADFRLHANAIGKISVGSGDKLSLSSKFDDQQDSKVCTDSFVLDDL